MLRLYYFPLTRRFELHLDGRLILRAYRKTDRIFFFLVELCEKLEIHRILEVLYRGHAACPGRTACHPGNKLNGRDCPAANAGNITLALVTMVHVVRFETPFL